jgi:hypothetical protein
VAARYLVQGTHRGEFLGIPGSSRQVTIQAVESYRLAGGKLAEQWAVMDALGLLQQLGAVPGPGKAMGALSSIAAANPKPVPGGLLTRKRSQVQTLSRPPNRL